MQNEMTAMQTPCLAGSPRLRRLGQKRRGFTLIEAAIVTVIVGIGVLAIVELLASGTMANSKSTEQTTALHLAGNIREASLRVPYSSIFDLEDAYSPPVDATLSPINALTGWSQVVDVQSVDPDRITLVIPDDPSNPTSRITVTTRRHGVTIYTTSWLAASPE